MASFRDIPYLMFELKSVQFDIYVPVTMMLFNYTLTLLTASVRVKV